MLEPYAGYLHLMPRTVAAAAGLLPLDWTLVVFLTGAVAFTTWASATIVLCLPGPAAWIGAAAPLLAFGGSEVLGTPTNLQWITVVALAAIAVSPPGAAANKGRDGGLRQPVRTVLPPLPAGLCRPLWVMRAHRPEIAACLLALLSGVVQGALVLSEQPSGDGGRSPALFGTLADLVAASVGSPWGTVSLAAVAAGLTVGGDRLPRIGLVLLTGLVLASIAVKFAPMPDMFAGGVVGHRYWYVPSGLWLLCLGLMLAEPAPRLRLAGTVGLVCFLLGYAYQPFFSPAPVHYDSWQQGIRDGTYRYPPDKTVDIPRR